MKPTLLIALLCLLARVGFSGEPVATARAAERNKPLGVGVVLGTPTGFSAKYWESARIAYQGALGAGYGGGLVIGLDYLVHDDVFRRAEMPFYYGAGAYLGNAPYWGPRYTRGDLALGVRAVFGVTYFFPEHPFDAAIEIGPALVLTPVVQMGMELGIAVRFYP